MRTQTHQYYPLLLQILAMFCIRSKKSAPVELLFSTTEQIWFASFMTTTTVPHRNCHE